MRVSQYSRFSLAIAILLISVNLNALSFAADDEQSDTLLKGLISLYVQVVPIDPKTAQKGIAAAQLRRETETRLRKAGIKVLSEPEYDRLRRSATYPLARLEVSVAIDNITIADSSLKINSISVQVRQRAFLTRNPTIRIFATTWRRQAINYSNSLADVHQTLRDIVNEFIAAYVSANPK